MTFFRLALAAPLAAPLLFRPIGGGAAGAILFLSLQFGGIQYAVFAVVLIYAIGRLGSPERIKGLAYVAPLIFVPVQAIGWLFHSYVGHMASREVGGMLEALFPLAVYSVVLGYVYVGIVMVVYHLFISFGLVHDQPAP